ncbi:MAG: bifunctional phosphoribosylaminoimidazolecarboxamide formyltransferase/IMP cyclohydrolase [Methylacidiphilales bacterium]|nr:bifunctional phosphoribosylaminoimidazolecarboxamide formyltransferase/IMP cyclohydrolase [Candidatus Methylacidiphilales bacterium]
MKNALLSITDKRGIIPLAKKLIELGWHLYATSSTESYLQNHAVPCTAISAITKFPEILQGRVKTLHPIIHGGLLTRRTPEDDQTLQQFNIPEFSLAVINLYPFEEFLEKNPAASTEEVLDYMDIGGPAMIRSAIKNYKHVIALTDPADYDLFISYLIEGQDSFTETMRLHFATKAAQLIMQYDLAIAKFFSRIDKQSNCLRYGENPHQLPAYFIPSVPAQGIALATFHQGKQLSYNNYLDIDSGCALVYSLSALTSACSIIKHGNPCGVAYAPTNKESYQLAYRSDPESAFGGIICFNKPLDADTAQEIVTTQFCEVVIAPSVDEQSLAIFKQKPSIRVVSIPHYQIARQDIRTVAGGYLLQPNDSITSSEIQFPADISQVNKLNCELAWSVATIAKSNAIVIVSNLQTIAISCGFTSRVRATEQALLRFLSHPSVTSEVVLASDGFFPFADSIELIAKHSAIKIVIQPKGSIRDAEVSEACRTYGILQLYASRRHFRH